MEETTNISDDVALLGEATETSEEGDERVTPPPKDNKDNKGTPPVEEAEDEESEDSIVEEGEEEEVEEEEEPEETEEAPEILPHERPTIAQIKAKYPELFKTFPQLRDMYFRERAFTEVFSTVDEARQAAQQAQEFVQLRGDVLSGSAEKLFASINEADPKALPKMAGKVLDALYKVSPELHYKATLPVLQMTIQHLFRDGKRNGNENTQNAALVIAEWLFDDQEVAKGKSVLPQEREEKSPEKDEISKEREKLQAERRADLLTRVSSDAQSGLGKLVDERGKNNRLKLNPNGNLSPFIVNQMRKQIMEEVGQRLEADTAHLRYMKSLWDRAKQTNYQGDWKDKILSAYLSRAKPLVAAVRAKIVAEALGSAVTEAEERGEKVQKQASRREPGPGRGGKEGSPRPIDPKRVDWRKTSDEDLLMGKATLKG